MVGVADNGRVKIADIIRDFTDSLWWEVAGSTWGAKNEGARCAWSGGVFGHEIRG